MKNVLLVAHDDGGQEARLQAALDLTRGLQGHLTCVDVARIPILTGDWYGSTDALLLADEREKEANNRVVIEERLTREDVPWTWFDYTGDDVTECVRSAAIIADIAVVNRAFGELSAGTIAIKSGKPLVVVPDETRSLGVAESALIAWDGSTPVEMTMQACIPLLKLASDVRILTVDDGSDRAPPETAAVYLSRHDIHANIHRVKGRHRDVEALVMEECAELRSAYCLMGAYGHGRVTQALFGGVTRGLLRNATFPLIIGH